MARIAIWSYLTGKYTRCPSLYERQIKSFREHYCTGEDCDFILFTDKPDIFSRYECRTVKADPPASRTEALCMKFRYIEKHKDLFRDYDYLQCCNSNLLCVRDVTLDWLIGDKLMAVSPHVFTEPRLIRDLHRPPVSYRDLYVGHKQSLGETAYDRKQSFSIPYLQAGVFLGERDFLFRLADRIEELRVRDLRNGIVPPWHDETYYNWVLSEEIDTSLLRIHPPGVLNRPENYSMPYVQERFLLVVKPDTFCYREA